MNLRALYIATGAIVPAEDRRARDPAEGLPFLPMDDVGRREARRAMLARHRHEDD